MLTEKRQQIIASYVDEHEMCRVADLSELTDSSPATIRRDLADLEARGVLKRIRGGAQSLRNFDSDIAQHIRFNLNIDAKRIIARLAAKHVATGMTIFLDAGTTIHEMVPFLKDIVDITVVTNGVDTALACLNAGIKTYILGGLIKHDTHATVGATAIKQLDKLNVNIAFIGSNGLTKKGKFTTPDLAEAMIKQTEIERADRVYILMDNSKLLHKSFAIFANIRQATLITNKLTNKMRQELPADLKFEEV